MSNLGKINLRLVIEFSEDEPDEEKINEAVQVIYKSCEEKDIKVVPGSVVFFRRAKKGIRLRGRLK